MTRKYVYWAEWEDEILRILARQKVIEREHHCRCLPRRTWRLIKQRRLKIGLPPLDKVRRGRPKKPKPIREKLAKPEFPDFSGENLQCSRGPVVQIQGDSHGYGDSSLAGLA